MLGSDEVPFAVVYIEPILQGSIIGIEGAVPSTGHIQVEEAVSVVIKKYGLQILAAPVRFQRGLSNGYEPPVPLLQKEPSRLVVPSPREHIDETVSIHIRLDERRAQEGPGMVHEGLPSKVVDLSGHLVLELDGRGHLLEDGRRVIVLFGSVLRFDGALLVDGDPPVGRDASQRLNSAVRPDHVHAVYRRAPAESEVQNRRYSGEVAARRHLLGVLLLPTRINRHLGTESEGVLSCPLEFYLEIIVVIRLVGGSILEHRGVFVNVVRNKIQVAIIIPIPVGRPRTLERRIQSP